MLKFINLDETTQTTNLNLTSVSLSNNSDYARFEFLSLKPGNQRESDANWSSCFLFILDGKGIITTTDKRSISLSPNLLVIISNEKSHKIVNSGERNLVCVCFRTTTPGEPLSLSINRKQYPWLQDLV